MPNIVFKSNLDEVQGDLYDLGYVSFADNVPRVGECIEFDFGEKSYQLEVVSIKYVCRLTQKPFPILQRILVELHIPRNHHCQSILEWTNWYRSHILGRQTREGSWLIDQPCHDIQIIVRDKLSPKLLSNTLGISNALEAQYEKTLSKIQASMNAATKRIRQGREHAMDLALSEYWQNVAKYEVYPHLKEIKPVRSIWDLPIAKQMYEADRRDCYSKG